ncbi:hypothetical protein QWY31_01335 [Cytophagales bacterium LB-30]|uniref:Porin n=1 Tax=Shiella aurantiaca TaxID=3058365 RepID=A0ABT8F186_9BACT|nr:putative porin [Shiella aurantiaca]MDN4164119.1 hypothetical protein [Shiella aurantiaca]
MHNCVFLRVIFKRLFLLFGFFCLAAVGQAQILDDSTKLVYGPTTTRYFYQDNIKYNQPIALPIDTLVKNMHRWTNINRFDNKVQDLGNVGTPTRFLYFQMPEVTGLSSGYSTFDIYFKSPKDFRYYDSKSPYTEVNALIGGLGRSIADVRFARNVNPNWNVGFDFVQYNTDKQLGPASRGDRNVSSTGYDFHTNYKSKNGKYVALGHLSRNYQRVFETGGIKPLPEDEIPADLFEYRNEVRNLDNSQSRQLKINHHIYHQYSLAKALQVYHEMDRTNERNYFYVYPLSTTTDTEYLGQPLIRNDSTLDSNIFKVFQNEVGVKGDVGPVFYSGFVKKRDVLYDHKYISDQRATEYYAGGSVRIDFADDFYVGGRIEVQDNGNNSIKAELQNKWLSGYYQRASYTPGFLYQRFFGNYYQWDNSMVAVNADKIYAQASLRLPMLTFEPNVTLTNLLRPVYFNEEKQPDQASGAVQILSPGTKLNFTFGAFHWDNEVIYTQLAGTSQDVVRIPDWFVNSNFYFYKDLFDSKMELQAGVDAHYRSAYYANGYDPITQQFHLQNDFLCNEVIWTDIYVNFKISRVLVLAKFTHANMGRQGEGYFLTPYYAGQRRTFDIGVKWQFFD